MTVRRAPIALTQPIQQAAKMTEGVVRGRIGDFADQVRRVWLMADEDTLTPTFSTQLAPQRAFDDGDDEDAQGFGIAEPVKTAEDAEKRLLFEVLQIRVRAQPFAQPTSDERGKPPSNELGRVRALQEQSPGEVGVGVDAADFAGEDRLASERDQGAGLAE